MTIGWVSRNVVLWRVWLWCFVYVYLQVKWKLTADVLTLIVWLGLVILISMHLLESGSMLFRWFCCSRTSDNGHKWYCLSWIMLFGLRMIKSWRIYILSCDSFHSSFSFIRFVKFVKFIETLVFSFYKYRYELCTCVNIEIVTYAKKLLHEY